jgi:hypothetical protein
MPRVRLQARCVGVDHFLVSESCCVRDLELVIRLQAERLGLRFFPTRFSMPFLVYLSSIPAGVCLRAVRRMACLLKVIPYLESGEARAYVVNLAWRGMRLSRKSRKSRGNGSQMTTMDHYLARPT